MTVTSITFPLPRHTGWITVDAVYAAGATRTTFYRVTLWVDGATPPSRTVIEQRVCRGPEVAPTIARMTRPRASVGQRSDHA